MNNYDVVQGFEKAVVTYSTGILQLKRMPDNIVETTISDSGYDFAAEIILICIQENNIWSFFVLKFKRCLQWRFQTLGLISLLKSSFLCTRSFFTLKSSLKVTMLNLSGRGGFIVQSMAHAKTQVRISLGDIYMVKILNKKELWTLYRLPWNCDIYLMVIAELQWWS